MSKLLNVYDLNLKKVAVLQNAYKITETQELNKIYTLDFSIPSTDEKVKYLQPFYYVRYGIVGEIYRIIKIDSQEENTGELTINCEHAIATLCDDVMFGAIQYGGAGIRTAKVIEWLLDQQTEVNGHKHWQLAECDFDRKFEYL